jgi:2-dehydro-3-deoxyphosphogluconate aldolase / (4S)-4-hydroxy-2-oxoglutarate aldolase
MRPHSSSATAEPGTKEQVQGPLRAASFGDALRDGREERVGCRHGVGPRSSSEQKPIIEPGQAKQAASAGAQFLVSPGSTPTLLGAMTDTGLPYLPGVATVSEILCALEAGYTELKFFPAEASGGADYLRSIGSPIPAAQFCPTGGITTANAAQYLALPNVGCVGGSWITPSDVVASRDWARITELAAAAATL